MASLHPGFTLGAKSSRDQISQLDPNDTINDFQSATNEKRDTTLTYGSSSISFGKEEPITPKDEAPETPPHPSELPQPSYDPKSRNNFEYFVVTEGGPSNPEKLETTIE